MPANNTTANTTAVSPTSATTHANARPMEDLSKTVNNLASTEATETRAKALADLEQFAAVDIVVSPAWGTFQDLFSLLLVGNDEALAAQGLGQWA